MAAGTKKKIMAADGTTLIKVGPAGYLTYSPAVSWDGKDQTEITRIYISGGTDGYSDYIQSFQYEYVEDGILKLSPIHGNQHSGSFFNMVEFTGPSEYITGLTGTYSCYDVHSCGRVTSLTIETNVKTYEAFGTSEEALDGALEFDFQFGPGNNFGGFYGTFTSDAAPPVVDVLVSIGVYVKPSARLGMPYEPLHKWSLVDLPDDLDKSDSQ